MPIHFHECFGLNHKDTQDPWLATLHKNNNTLKMCMNQQKDAIKDNLSLLYAFNLKMEKIPLSIMNMNSTYCYLSSINQGMDTSIVGLDIESKRS